MKLRGKYGKPSRFQQAAFVANSLLSGRVSIAMPGVRGGSSAKSARNARRRANKRNRNNISNISYSSGSMLTGGTGFTGPRQLRQRYRPMIYSSEWMINGGVVNIPIANRLTPHVQRSRRDHVKHTDVYEVSGQHDFDSPLQGITVGVHFPKSTVTSALNVTFNLDRQNVGTTASADAPSSLTYGGDAGGIGAVNLETLVGSFRAQDINMIIESCWEKMSVQNTCSNTLEFVYEVWKARYPLFNTTNNNLTVYADYQPAGIASTLVQIEDVGRNASDMPYNLTASGSQDVSVYRYGSSLKNYKGMTAYWVCKGTKKFVLKPGEQRDITIRAKGPHRVDLAKYRMFTEAPCTAHWTLTARANQVGATASTVVSHGSGQYSLVRKTMITTRCGGATMAPTRRQMDTGLTAVTAANQENINPETDANQTYTESG